MWPECDPQPAVRFRPAALNLGSLTVVLAERLAKLDYNLALSALSANAESFPVSHSSFILS